jgi:type I restriction enzyme M protein
LRGISFRKYLDNLERANEQRAELAGRKYEPIIDRARRWLVWAAPKKKDGSFDHDKMLTGRGSSSRSAVRSSQKEKQL